MSNYVNVNQTSNTVQLQNTDRQVVITGTPEQRDVTIVQPEVSVVTVSTVGPQGPRGERGQDGAGIETGSLATTGSNTFIGNQIISGTLNVTGGVTGSLFGTSSWSNNAVSASYIQYSNIVNLPTLLSSSVQIATDISGAFNASSSSLSSRLTVAESSITVLNAATSSYILAAQTSSMRVLSSSFAATASYALNAAAASSFPYTGSAVISGSLSVIGPTTFTGTTGGTVFSSNADTLIMTGSFLLTGSMNVVGLITGTSSLALTASYIEYTNVANKPTLLSSSAQIATNISGAFTSVSGGLSSRITIAESSINLLNAATSSYVLTSQTASMRVLSAATASYVLQAVSASYATVANSVNTLNQDVAISGSLTITQNLTVFGSSSIVYITSSQLNIGTNIITVNTNTPAVRFGGLAVIDSGSSPRVSGSILLDSQKNQFIFVHQGTTATSSVFLLGPETFNDLGNETYLTKDYLPKGSGIEHLYDSNIKDTGTVVSITSNTQITGSLIVTSGITGSLNGTASFAVSASYIDGGFY